MENPFGNNVTISEYSDKYLQELDRFIGEARETGVWVFPSNQITAESTDWTILMVALDNNVGVKGYMPMWSSPAEGLAMSLHIDGPALQSVPLDFFIQVILDNPKPGIVAAINPVIRNGKLDEAGNQPIIVIPPVLIPFDILLAIYKGLDIREFSAELASWILASKSLTYDG
jgi:hypothetical protein